MRVGEKRGREPLRRRGTLHRLQLVGERFRVSWIHLETEAHVCPQAQGRGTGAPVGTGSSPRLRTRTPGAPSVMRSAASLCESLDGRSC